MTFKYIIYETANFTIGVPHSPHISRTDGGHIVVISKNRDYHTLTDLPSNLAHEMIDLAGICGSAMSAVLPKFGIDIGIINYQINGNWSVFAKKSDPIHLHVYGRARSSEHQIFGEALYFPNPDTGFYDGFTTLEAEEVEQIKEQFLKAISKAISKEE